MYLGVAQEILPGRHLRHLAVVDEADVKSGKVPERDMYNTYNMGIGACAAVDPAKADEALRILSDAGEKAYIIGEVASGENGVEIC